MNPKALIVSILATAAGAGGLELHMRRFESELTGGSTVQVLVATRDIKLEDTLDATMLAEREMPAAFVESRHIPVSDRDDVLGVRVSMPVRAGEAVLWTDLATAQEERSLSGLVTEGLRAVSLTDQNATFDGLLRPGDRVDVMLTTREETSTLLQNLLVLAVSGNMGNGRDGHGAGTGRGSVALSATIEQSQILTHAMQLGGLRLSLRNPDDIVIVQGLPSASSDSNQRPLSVARAEATTTTVETSHAK